MLIVRNQKSFYPTAGTITIHAGSQPMKKTLFATLSKLTLIEITISSSYHSIPVPSGECVTLAPATINIPSTPHRIPRVELPLPFEAEGGSIAAKEGSR